MKLTQELSELNAALEAEREATSKGLEELESLRSDIAGDQEQSRALIGDYEEKNEAFTREIGEKEARLAQLRRENEEQNQTIARLNQEKLSLEGERVKATREGQEKNKELLAISGEASRLEQKKNGRIRHLGFSCHGAMPVLKRFLEAYGKDMEFCQLQLNYIDWTFQNGKEKVDLLNEYHIPVWVMEPLRGGRLARLSDQEAAPLKAMRPDETIPAWAFRFLQSIPSVTMVLSGMSDLEQMKANIATFQTEAPLNEKEMAGLMEVAGGMVSQTALPCTACHYCVSHCPKGLNIPELLALYNEHSFTGGGFLAPMALSAIPQDKWPSACIGCRSCEKVCPQQLKISEAMADFTAKLNG